MFWLVKNNNNNKQMNHLKLIRDFVELMMMMIYLFDLNFDSED